MQKKSIILCLLLILTACTPLSPSATPAPTETSTTRPKPTRTLRPSPAATSTPSVTPTRIPPPGITSPDGKFVAKLYTEYDDHPSGKAAIEVSDAQGTVLWVVPYQGEMPTGDPRPSLRIYHWAADSSALYFYYSFGYDGFWTLFDGCDLQALDVTTGKVASLAGGCVAFAFSPDMRQLAYVDGSQVTLGDMATRTRITTTVQNKGLQAGPIFWSPSGKRLVFYVLVDDGGNAQMVYLNVETLKQKVLLDYFVEIPPFESWTENEAVRYKLNGLIVVVDPETGVEAILGTATPQP